MRPDQDSVERIRRHEVSRTLKKTNLSPDDEDVIDLFSRSLVGRLLHGPISEVLARAELSFGDRVGRCHAGSNGAEAKTERLGRREIIRLAKMGSPTSSTSSKTTGRLASLHD